MRKKIEAGFPAYGYSGPTDGTWLMDETEYFTGRDFRTVKQFARYRAAGLDVLLLQGNDPYSGEPFAASQLKKNMDNALAAGIDKVIVFDKRIHDLSASEAPLLGEGRAFRDAAALTAYVRNCMKDYREHPAFYGVMLTDEPSYRLFPALGAVFRAVKAAAPEAFVQCNLLPLMSGNSPLTSEDGTPETLLESYRRYLEGYLDATGAPNLLTDCYPMCSAERAAYVSSVLREQLPGYEEARGNRTVYPLHLRSVLAAAETCRDRGVEFHNVAQSFAMDVRGNPYMRMPSRADVFWEVRLLLGLGVKSLAWFTYWRKQRNRTDGESFPDGTAMVTSSGRRTPLYRRVRAAMREARRFSETLAPYRFRASGYFIPEGAEPPDFMIGLKNEAFDLLETYRADGPLFVTELEKKDGGRMYMLFSAEDPAFSGGKIKVFARFRAKKLEVYRKGRKKEISCEFGTYGAVLGAGDAVYIIPKK